MFNYWDNSTQSQLETVLSVAFYTVVIIIGILGKNHSLITWSFILKVQQFPIIFKQYGCSINLTVKFFDAMVTRNCHQVTPL